MYLLGLTALSASLGAFEVYLPTTEIRIHADTLRLASYLWLFVGGTWYIAQSEWPGSALAKLVSLGGVAIALCAQSGAFVAGLDTPHQTMMGVALIILGIGLASRLNIAHG
jgi:hypothetical protein